MGVFKVDSQNFKKEVLEENQIVVVDFYADWCGPCRLMAPIIEELSQDEKYQSKVKFVKVNVDHAPDLASSYEIFSIPTFIIFKNGQLMAQITGAVDKLRLMEEIDKLLE